MFNYSGSKNISLHQRRFFNDDDMTQLNSSQDLATFSSTFITATVLKRFKTHIPSVTKNCFINAKSGY